MSFKDNKFMVALGGGTLAGAALLYFVGAKGQGHYDQAKVDFEAAKTEASGLETGHLYPTRDNHNGKQKALGEYLKATDALQSAFDAFRPKQLKNISPQEFTNNLKSADEQVRQAFGDSRTKVPDPFFCGFENYKTTLARGNTTGVLDFQLAGIRNIMLALAKSGATELKNLHRPLLAEEEGKTYVPIETDVARSLPFEVTFQGPEKAVREFLSAIVKPHDQYVVIRSLRVDNAKKEPPRTSDAKFDKLTASRRSPASEVFGGGAFVLPADDSKPAGDKKPDEAPVVDSSRILSQVLGDEELQVFIRMDILQFLPSKPLPKSQ